MGQRILLPDAEEVVLELLRNLDRNSLCMVLRSAGMRGVCPRCQSGSGRVHSRYLRTLADLPWEGIPVRIELRVRRFFCDAVDCEQRIFTERLPGTVAKYGRRTCRLGETLDRIVMALGGAAGSRLAEQLGIFASGSTLLRQIRRTKADTNGSPRVLGIDDWAWRKGHRYGTILCDLERGKVIDLLPDRSRESMSQWLRSHRGVEIISRDRASLYAEAATKAAPNALQVADRWHLLRNVSEALTSALSPHHRLMNEVARAVSGISEPPASENSEKPQPRREALKSNNRELRLARYEAVIERLREGCSEAEIAHAFGLDRRTIRSWVCASGFPERVPVQRASQLDCHREYLEQRWEQGCHNAAQLWRELRERGYGGQSRTVRSWTYQQSEARGCRLDRRRVAAALPHLSPRSATWMILNRSNQTEPMIDVLCSRSPEIAQCVQLAREFFRMVAAASGCRVAGLVERSRGQSAGSLRPTSSA
jgi:transposase